MRPRRYQPIPRQRHYRLLSSSEVRRMRAIRAESVSPVPNAPLTTLIVSGRKPPTITTEMRAIETRHGKGWQVTVSASGIMPEMLAPPKFVFNPLPPPKRVRSRYLSLLNDAYRPRWIGFQPEPQLVRPRLVEMVLTHRGQRFEPLSIQGEFDNRKYYRDPSYPWGCVCKVISGGRSGSGVLIGPRHVLTASHVIDWAAGWAVVEVHRFDTTFSSGSCASRLFKFTAIDAVTPSTVDEDYAVITLFDRLGDQFGWMGNMTYDSGWDDDPFFRTIGYAGDKADAMRPVYERDFHLDEDEFDLGSARAMTCGADLTYGQSGSPIFAFGKHDGMPYVVAVVSAAGTDGNNYCAGGSLLTRLVREARQIDP
jgi:V8-like Glu-specific endopeptidase